MYAEERSLATNFDFLDHAKNYKQEKKLSLIINKKNGIKNVSKRLNVKEEKGFL